MGALTHTYNGDEQDVSTKCFVHFEVFHLSCYMRLLSPMMMVILYSNHLKEQLCDADATAKVLNYIKTAIVQYNDIKQCSMYPTRWKSDTHTSLIQRYIQIVSVHNYLKNINLTVSSFLDSRLISTVTLAAPPSYSLSLSLSLSLSVYLSQPPSLSVSVCLSLFPSLSVCLSVYLSVSLPLSPSL